MKTNELIKSAIFICISLIIVSNLTSCFENTDIDDQEEVLDILIRLKTLNGIASAVEIDTEDHFLRLFELKIEQPVDHSNPSGEKFLQKVYIGHISEDLPVAFETEGYSRSSNRTRELSSLLNINQIAVEHRFNGESVPSHIDWSYLTIWQAANDHHKIVNILKEIYSEAWVSSGASKGGDTAIFHRRFFPNDVDATVAYVAPILFEEYDSRYLNYYSTQGDDVCRQKLKNYQRNMLININAFSPLFDEYVEFVNNTYSVNMTFTLPFESIVYHAIREDYHFEFWSSEIENCDTVPDNDATIQELFDHFVNVFDIFLFFSDYGVDFWTPWYYQSKTEIGNYAYDVSHLQDLEMNFDPLVDLGIPTSFDPSVMSDISTWFSSSASNVILIYGEEDPWTLAAFDHTGNNDVITIINPNTKHGTRISDLSAGDKDIVMNKLNEWLNLSD